MIRPGVSIDESGKPRFIAVHPNKILPPGSKIDNGFWYYHVFPVDDGLDSCSNKTISFHNIEPEMMYTMEFLIYHLKLFEKL